MDISKIIGEDGSGKDIGTGMKDGGKADAEDLTEETTLDPIMDVADLHLHHPDLPEEGTVDDYDRPASAGNARAAQAAG